MSDPRVTGLILMGLSIAAFMGTTDGTLPSVTFFPALVLFGLGAIKFMRTNREAMGVAEEKTKQRLNPVIRENRHAQALAERQSNRRGAGLQDINTAMGERMPSAQPGRTAALAIDFDESDDALRLDSDVSFPVELQQGEALADQLSKLSKLLEQGVLSAEEYAVAKTKLLG